MNEVFQYSQAGEIYLWKYQSDRNFPGYQMAWSGVGKENFQLFLGLLENAESGTYRTLNTHTPKKEILSIPNNKDNSLVAVEKLRIEVSSEIEWNFEVEATTLNIILSPSLAKEWSEIIGTVKSQKELSFKEIHFWW